MLSSGSLLPLSTHDAMLQCEEPQFAENLDFASKGDQGSPIRSVSPVLYGPLVNHMSVDSGMSTKDVQDPTAVHGSCGLWNIGNTCFMNAGIQSLASCAPLLKFLFEQFQYRQGMQGTLTGAFYVLLCKLWSGQYSVIYPLHFKELLGLYHPQFRDYRQHDCQEFLALLLDTLHEQLNQVPSICVLDTSVSGKCSSPDDQHQNLLNNQDTPPEGRCAENMEAPQASASELKVLHVESVASGEEEEVGSSVSHSEASPGSLSPATSVETGHARTALKRTSSATAEAVSLVLVSEDSNHSSISVHSTDSEQSSAFKKLKIETEASGAACHFHTVVDKASMSDGPSEVPVTQVSLVTSGSASVSSSRPARNISSDAMFHLVDSVLSGGKLDHSNSGGNRLVKPRLSVSSTESSTHCKRVVRKCPPFSATSDATSAQTLVTETNSMDISISCPSESHTDLGSSSLPSCEGNSEKQAPALPGSPQLLPCLEDYYCKETKTLNTNVLVSTYMQGDIAVDSEKFAKVDNLTQVPAMKEVNLLQEALQGMEEDKVEKTLIGKTLSSKRSNVITSTSSTNKASNSANLRVVKTRNSAILHKHCQNPNLLNNSYDYDDEMLGFPRMVDPSAQKGLEGKVLSTQCGTSGAEDSVKMMAMAAEMTPLEVEKNVQMQALSKFNTNVIKSNIREDISDRASTSGSTETEEADMEAEAESTEEEEEEEEQEEEEEAGAHSSIVEESRALPNPARCFTTADVAAANKAWEDYNSKNNSIVVDTFQGQFKSTVVCSECSHVSVTYEPFMYLSLPIPHAMERQISVVFIRPCNLATRYLVTLHKNDKVQRLRQSLQALTGTESSDVILAEVLDNHVSRILDDNIMLRYVNDTNRSLYAFEMLPPPAVTDLKSLRSSPDLPHSYSSNSSSNIHLEKEHCASFRTSTVTGPVIEDTLGAELVTCSDQSGESLPHTLGMDSFLSEVSSNDATVGSSTAAVSDQSETFGDDNQLNYSDSSQIGTGLWEWTRGDTLASSSNLNDIVSVPPSSPTSLAPTFQVGSDANCVSCEGDFANTLPTETVGMDSFHAGPDFFASRIWPDNRLDSGDPSSFVAGPNAAASTGSGGGVMDQWRMCAICLEEMVDSELLTHASCAGIFCHNCLEMSAKHSGDLAECCPVCLAPIDMTQDFVPLASSNSTKSKVRILVVPVTFRCERAGTISNDYDGNGMLFELVCSPRIIYVASKQDASTLFSQVDRVIPVNTEYTLHFTDGQVLNNNSFFGVNVLYHINIFGDCIAQDVTIQLTVQAASEVLDETNPWYCPCCCRNQCAKKTMTVWRYPDSLIIHLKRFVFEDLSSTKIDNRVVFPHTNLDVTSFLSGPSVYLNAYDLYSVVCHYGGANSGHYTAFTCHPLTSEWYHYNDESVTPQRPSESEFDSCYVLFYQRKGTCKKFNLVKDLPALDDENADHLTSSSAPLALVPVFSPPPSSPSSTIAAETATTEEDASLTISIPSLVQQAEADSTQSYDFYN
ncbi:hypothetical protein C0Q70_21317 [Pomacea canaliculata]|uniref:ubiquitinyl hydrolase 1 n=1 Tax=Pomacea canaliculata TaxID=400727 RepID=A0A2T7NC84_POMCA|nr:hypothetical protein C0Q70_21317 [Pomacea canaliculata]